MGSHSRNESHSHTRILGMGRFGCTKHCMAYCITHPRVLLEAVQVWLGVWNLPQLLSRQTEKEAKRRSFKGRECAFEVDLVFLVRFMELHVNGFIADLWL